MCPNLLHPYDARDLALRTGPRVPASSRTASLQFVDRNVEYRGVDHPVALELHPEAVGLRARKNQAELHLWPAIGDQRMSVDEVNQVVAPGQHVGPCSQIFLEPVSRSQVEVD